MTAFKGLSKGQLVAAACIAIPLAFVAAIAAAALVSLLPVSEKAQTVLLCVLGIASIGVSYFVLIKMPENMTHTKAARMRPTGHSHDCCRGAREIKRIFCHIPTMPKIAMVSSRIPRAKKPNTVAALAMILSLHHRIAQLLRSLLRRRRKTDR